LHEYRKIIENDSKKAYLIMQCFGKVLQTRKSNEYTFQSLYN
jgi:hypothetical protein